MEGFLNRYRNITILLLVIFAQLMLLAINVKNEQNVRFIRLWTVTAVSPLARLVEGLRGGGVGFIRTYITLHDASAENRRLQAEVDKLKLENIFLKNDANTAKRAEALQIFQKQSPSKTEAARVFGVGSGRQAVDVDRGSLSKIMRGMAVITPEGIVGKVTAVYPTLSSVLLITDPEFAAGVVSTKGVRGTLKGRGKPLCIVDYVDQADKVEPGDWFFTSGDDRVFPRGMPVGVVKSVREAQPYKEIWLEPSGMGSGPEEVLIVTEGVHQEVPDKPPANQPVYILTAPPPPAGSSSAPDGTTPPVVPAGGTQADRMRSVYKTTAEQEGVVLGGGSTGQVFSKPPDFSKLPVNPGSPGATPPQPAAAPAGTKSTAAPPVTPPAQKGTGPGVRTGGLPLR